MHHRFIPARAGNTSAAGAGRGTGSVHPRSRGEHDTLSRPEAAANGSSPLARGTPAGLGRRPSHLRFIPARAGNTRRRAPAAPPRPVHPRSRGEHPSPHPRPAGSSGSSPLARGTHRPHPRAPALPRFIPARAGNTPRGSPAATRRAVHPRSRGEHHGPPPHLTLFLGSSPLARGTRPRRASGRRGRRFIPARAGNTAGAHSPPPFSPVHPRSRGEHAGGPRAGWPDDGSSPLARGTRPATL